MTTAACGAEIEDIQLCTCGQSASHPFCDKSHQLVNAGTGLNFAPVPLSELKKHDALSTQDLLVIHAAARRRASLGCRPKLSDALSHQQVIRETRRREIENLSKDVDVDEQVLCQDPHCDRQSSTSSNNSAVAVAFPEDFPTTTTTTTTTATTSSPSRSRHHRHHRHRHHNHHNESESAATSAAIAPSSDIEDTVEDPQVVRQRSANNDQQVTPVFSWRRMRKRDLLSVTRRELAQHVTRDSCWVAVGSNVYDVTEFLDKHKSGAGTILKHAGTDITHHVQFHSSAMMKLLKKHYLIGKLVADPADEDEKQSTLLGVILTAHTTLGGTKMIFRYPPVIRDKVSQATLREFAASKAKAADDDELRHPPQHHHHVPHHIASSSSTSSTSATSATPGATDSPADHSTSSASTTTNPSNTTNVSVDDTSNQKNNTGDVLAQIQSGDDGGSGAEATNMQFAAFGLPSVELASLLMPKPALCDLPFRVVVENTKFIGHPTSIPPRDRRRQRVADAAAAAPLTPVRLANNVDEDMSDSGEFDELDDDFASLPNGVADTGAESAHAADGSDGSDDGDDGSDAKENNHARVEITRVNIVFGVPISESQEEEYHRMAAQLGTALRHEEMRCCYLSRELHTLLSIRERWLADVASAKPGEQPPTHSELYQRIVTESHLASELRHMYHSIRDYGIASLRFNNWINVFVSLRQVSVDFSVQRPMRPYQTLLLLDSRIADVGDAKQRASLPLPPDVSPRLAALLDACRPTKSFRALQLETQIPLSQLFRLASHLVYWRKARVVHMLTKSNVYILKPDVARWKEQHRFLYRVAGEQVKLQADSATVRKRDSIAVMCVKFARQFPSFRLAEMLERFSTPKPLAEHMSQFAPTLQRDFVNVVVWLLKHNLLEQMFVYVFLMVPPPPPPPPGADAATLAAAEVAMQVVEDAAESRSVLAYHGPTRQLMYACDNEDAVPGRVRLPSSSSGAVDDDAGQTGLEWLEQQTASTNSDDAHANELAAVYDANARCSLFASAPSPLYEYEQRHIATLDDGSPQYRLLKRVVRYFRGTHHLEEIMWRENVERIDLVQVLDKYKSILVQCSQQQDDHP